MVITNPISPPILQTSFLEPVAHLYHVLGSPVRLSILSALDSSSLTFTEMMRTLDLNPKTLASALSLMGQSNLLRKSYPYQVYAITPLGRRIIREQVLALHESLRSLQDSQLGT